MTISRREFVRIAGAGGMLAMAGACAPTAARGAPGIANAGRSPAALRILVLGGTGFIGPYQVRYAIERGHQVTVFNRGRRQTELPDGVEHLQGDRNDDLESLKGREWDVVIDNPTTLPFWVRDAASLLKDHANQYIFISTISVYASAAQPGMDEDAPLAEYIGADPYAETMQSFAANANALYGPLKALSELEAEKWFPGRTTVVRPGLIVGPGDPTDRFTYWPVRVARGGEVLAPGTPADPVQVIDARDLSEWIIRLAEANATGIFNATGPAQEMGIGAMLESMRPLARQPVRFTFADADFLEANEVQAWTHMPAWVPPQSEYAGLGSIDIRRALRQGLTFRPLAATSADTLRWFESLPAERQGRLQSGLTAEREREVLEAWHRVARS